MRAGQDFHAVIFDLDGLVLDSEAGYFVAWQAAAGEMGFELTESLCRRMSGLPGSLINQGLLAHFGADFDLAGFHARSRRCWHNHVQQYGIPVKTGFQALLALLEDLHLPYALATNSRRDDALQCLQWAGLAGVFNCLISREDVRHPKPAADIFLKAAQDLQQPAQHCLVLEDSPVGVAAAVAANIPCFFVPSLQPADRVASRQARQVFTDLAAVADFISVARHHPL